MNQSSDPTVKEGLLSFTECFLPGSWRKLRPKFSIIWRAISEEPKREILFLSTTQRSRCGAPFACTNTRITLIPS